MTEKNRTENLGADPELTDNELDAIAGGDRKTPPTPKLPPPKTPGLFEISDYSFDIE